MRKKKIIVVMASIFSLAVCKNALCSTLEEIPSFIRLLKFVSIDSVLK